MLRAEGSVPRRLATSEDVSAFVCPSRTAGGRPLSSEVVTSPEPDPADPADLVGPTGLDDPVDLAGPWRRRIDTGWRITAIGVVLLPAGQGDPVTVAGSAAAVWELLAEPITGAELVDRLAERFGEEPAVVQAGLRVLMGQLLELGAIERSPSSLS